MPSNNTRRSSMFTFTFFNTPLIYHIFAVSDAYFHSIKCIRPITRPSIPISFFFFFFFFFFSFFLYIVTIEEYA